MLKGRCELFYREFTRKTDYLVLRPSRCRTPTSEATNRADSWSLTGLFLTTCDAMEFAEMGHLQEVCLNLPVNLLRVLHAKRLECEKSMELMASFYHSRLHWSRWDSSAVATLLDFSLLGASRKVR